MSRDIRLLDSRWLTDENLEYALSYAHKEDDIFVLGFPKCGNHWLYTIVKDILYDGQPVGNERLNSLEHSGAALVLKSPYASHLPIDLLPLNPLAKYVIVLRNPKDAVVSMYRYAQHLFETGDIHAYVSTWITQPQLNYFQNVRDYWTHSCDENILFVFYERMKRNPLEEIVRIGEFLGNRFVEKLMANNEKTLQELLMKTCFEYMQSNASDHAHSHYRQGNVGDWRSYLTRDDSDLIDAKFTEYFSGIELESIWREDMKWH